MPERRDARATALAAVAALNLAASGAAAAAADPQDFTQIERGRYLTLVADCAACHTVPGSGVAFAGGRPIETPFGMLIATNITPDRETGIGAWTDREFVDAVRGGRGRDGKPLYPAMPYPYLTRLSDDDVMSIRAFLNTVPAVRNSVDANQLPFPFSIRASLRVWNALYFRDGRFAPVADKPADWNRGAYLVEGPAHCGACHTPKTLLGGDRSGRALQGFSLQGWFAPNITNDQRRGLGTWSIDDVVAYLATGHNRTSAASGPMGEEVALSSSQMTTADLRAIATYLKDQPGQDGDVARPVDPTDRTMTVGAAIYTDVCAACHRMDGSGVPGLLPMLRGSPAVQSAEPTSLLRLVLRGAQSVATAASPTGPAMPAFAWQLDDDEVAAVTTFVRNAWGNAAPAVTPDDAKTARAQLAARSD
jgi:mono/diheme cytochrome c family protein